VVCLFNIEHLGKMNRATLPAGVGNKGWRWGGPPPS
jgi:hypothetical protein